MSQYMVFFGNAAAARNGLTAMPVDSGEDYFQIEATNYLVNNMGRSLYILAHGVITAAIANLTTYRYKLANESEYASFTTQFGVDQTGAKGLGFLSRVCKEFPSGAKLHCDLNNNNNSQVDVVVFILGDSPNEKITIGPNMQIPAGYELREFTGATTVTAAVMSDVALTPVTFSPNAKATYHIGAIGLLGATCIGGRVKHKGSGTQKIIAGALGGDIATPDTGLMVYGDFGSFVGSEYPLIKFKCVAADTAQRILLLIKQTGMAK